MSTPSSSYSVTIAATASTNAARSAGSAPTCSNALSLPSFQPPMAIDTFTPCLCAPSTSLRSRPGSSRAVSPPAGVGSTKA